VESPIHRFKNRNQPRCRLSVGTPIAIVHEPARPAQLSEGIWIYHPAAADTPLVISM
jgi:hypothetical protein